MPSIFLTHARTLTELRDEFLSDLHRRLRSLDLESHYEKRVGRLQAIARAKMELESILGFWSEVELRNESKSKPISHLKPNLSPRIEGDAS